MKTKKFEFDHQALKEPSTGEWREPLLEIPGDTHRWCQAFTYVYALEGQLWAAEYYSGLTEYQESEFADAAYGSNEVEAWRVRLEQTTQTVVSIEVKEAA